MDFAATPVVPLDAAHTAALSDLEKAYAAPAYVKADSQTGPRLVIVAVHLPHVTAFGLPDPNLELVYRWPFEEELSVGELVLCPGTRLHPETWTGIVLSLDGNSTGYSGYVRNLLGKASSDDEGERQ